jgi:act minimal PKS acyl carrier protein
MQITVDDLLRIIKESAGEGEALAADADLTDTTFDEMGYDSLALIETAARIEQDYGIAIPDEDVTELKTPRAMVTLVNDLLAALA